MDIKDIKNQAIKNTISNLQSYSGDNSNTRQMVDLLNPEMSQFKQHGTTDAYKNMVKSADAKLRLQHKVKTNMEKLRK